MKLNTISSFEKFGLNSFDRAKAHSNLTIICFLVIGYLLSISSISFAVVSPPDSSMVLKNYDIRNGVPVTLPLKSINKSAQCSLYPPFIGKPIQPLNSQLQAVDRLKSLYAFDTVIQWNQLNGLPHFLFNYHGTLTTASYPDPVEACLLFVENNPDLFYFQKSSLVYLFPSCIRSDSDSNVSHVFLQQEIKGIPVHQGVMRFNLDAKNRIISVSAGDIIPGISDNFLIDCSLKPVDAVLKISESLGFHLDSDQVKEIPTGQENHYNFCLVRKICG